MNPSPSELRCPACGESGSESMLEVRGVPVHCNVVFADQEAARRAALGDLHLRACLGCGMVYNAAFDPDLVEYSGHYENAQHFSPRFRRYLDDLVQRLIDRFELRGKDLVELGCGDGHFLAALCDRGLARGRGFDPAAPPGSSSSRVELRTTHFPPQPPVPADFVCFRHVLEHIARPEEFLRGLAQVLRGTGAGVYCEVPDAWFTLEGGGVWDLLYEHCSYFTAAALHRLFTRCGFRVARIESVFEGQFLAVEAFEQGEAAASPVASTPSPAFTAAVRSFSREYEGRVEEWAARIAQWRAGGASIALWGAGTKGVMFLNSVPGAQEVELVVDRSPRKRGRWIAGTGQRVVSPADLLSRRVDVVLVMNPAYRDEVQAELAELGLDPEVRVA